MSATGTRLLQTVIDQVLSSACSYVLVLLVARGATPRQLGVFLIVFGVVTLVTAVGRSAFGAILGMDLPGVVDDVTGRDLEARSAAAVLVLGAAASVPLLVVGALVGGPTAGALVLLALAVPAVLLQDLARYGRVARGVPGQAVVADALWFALPGGLVVVDVARGTTASPTEACLVWVSGLLVSLGWLAWRGCLRVPRFLGLAAWVASDRRRWHLAADSGMAGIAPVGNGVGAAAASSAVATAAVRGAAAVFAPLATLGMAVSLGAVPEAKRRTGSGPLWFLLRATGMLVALSVAWGVGVLLIPDEVGRELLGASWSVADPLTPYLAVEYVGLAMWTGGTAMLRYTDSTATALRIRLLYAPATLFLPVVAIAVTDDARWFVGVLAALGLGVGIAGLGLGIRRMRAAPQRAA